MLIKEENENYLTTETTAKDDFRLIKMKESVSNIDRLIYFKSENNKFDLNSTENEPFLNYFRSFLFLTIKYTNRDKLKDFIVEKNKNWKILEEQKQQKQQQQKQQQQQQQQKQKQKQQQTSLSTGKYRIIREEGRGNGTIKEPYIIKIQIYLYKLKKLKDKFNFGRTFVTQTIKKDNVETIIYNQIEIIWIDNDMNNLNDDLMSIFLFEYENDVYNVKNALDDSDIDEEIKKFRKKTSKKNKKKK